MKCVLGLVMVGALEQGNITPFSLSQPGATTALVSRLGWTGGY